jgi:hypothetical protein
MKAGTVLFVYWSAIQWPVHTTYAEIHSDALTMAFATIMIIIKTKDNKIAQLKLLLRNGPTWNND